MRFSLKTLLLVTTAAAVTCYSLLFATPLLGDAFYTVYVATILFGVAAAIQRQGARRAFWLGFVLVAAGYLWFSTPSVITKQLAAGLSGRNPLEPQLITTNLLNTCYEYYCLSNDGQIAAPPTFAVSPNPVTVRTYMARGPAALYEANANRVAFLATGHSALGLFFGWLGAIASRRMYRGRASVATAKTSDPETLKQGETP